MGPLAVVHSHCEPFFALISETRADQSRDVQIAMRGMNLACRQLNFHHTLANIEAKFTNVVSFNPEKKIIILNFA